MFDFIDDISSFFDSLMGDFNVSELLGGGLILGLLCAWIILGIWDRIKP